MMSGDEINLERSIKRPKYENEVRVGLGVSGGLNADENEQALGQTESKIDTEATPLQSSLSQRKKCPYLDTVNRQKLDFDQMKICSVTLTDMNVYACLVCGKFFQGRGKSSPAYTHSVHMGHFVFAHLRNARAYCLPDGYEIEDAALGDVKRCLAPQFSDQDIAALDSSTALARDVHGVSYLPGFMGINNLSCSDYISVVLHGLAHVTPLRDFMLHEPLPGTDHAALRLRERWPLLRAFAEVMRKMWSHDNFKSVISPVEFAHALSVSSGGRFTVTRRVEVSELLQWLLNELHRSLVAIDKERPGRKKGQGHSTRSVIHESFQGEVEVRSCPVTAEPTEIGADKVTVSRSPFLLLTLDVPPAPLFRDGQGAAVVPQVPLLQLLRKFDGRSWTERPADPHGAPTGGPVKRQYVLRRLPRFLIIHLNRFQQSGFNFAEEKNGTIVTFPVRHLEMKEYLHIDVDGTVDDTIGTKYDLVANMAHDSHVAQSVTSALTSPAANTQSATASASASGPTKSGSGNGAVTAGSGAHQSQQQTALSQGSYRVHLANRATGSSGGGAGHWFEIQDLHVAETMPQLVGLSESNLLIYERQPLQSAQRAGVQGTPELANASIRESLATT